MRYRILGLAALSVVLLAVGGEKGTSLIFAGNDSCHDATTLRGHERRTIISDVPFFRPVSTTPVSTGGNEVDRIRKVDPWRAWHGGSIARLVVSAFL